MKKVNPFFKILFVFFLIFIALYIALESGYYDVKMGRKATITEEESAEDTTEESTEEEEISEENESVKIAVDTKEKAIVAIATLMKQFNITLEEIAEQEN